MALDDGLLTLLQTEGIKAHQLQMQHASNAAQVNADGNGRLAELIRLKGMQDLDNVSMTEGLGVRYIQGPHPYYGSPDGKPSA